MKKVLFLSSIIAASLTSNIKAENLFTIGDLELTPGSDATVEIKLENEDTPTGIQFHLILPEGISLKTSGRRGLASTAFSCGKRLLDDGSVWSITNVNDLGENVYEVIAAQLENNAMYSAAEDLIYFGSTTVIKVSVNVSNTYTGGAFGFSFSKISKGFTTFESSYKGTFNGEVTMPLGANGYSSYSSCAPFSVSNATANYGVVNGDIVNLVTVENVPAFEGVILKGKNGENVTISAPKSEPAAPEANDLAACVLKSSFEPRTVYVLSTEGGETGFYLYTGSVITANHAYLPEGASHAPVVRFSEDTNSIENITVESNKASYNLMGVQTKNQKGISVSNGKIVYNK